MSPSLLIHQKSLNKSKYSRPSGKKRNNFWSINVNSVSIKLQTSSLIGFTNCLDSESTCAPSHHGDSRIRFIRRHFQSNSINCCGKEKDHFLDAIRIFYPKNKTRKIYIDIMV